MNDNESYRVLKQRIDIQAVREARRALDDYLAQHPPQPEPKLVMAHIFERLQDMPLECRTLYRKVEVRPH